MNEEKTPSHHGSEFQCKYGHVCDVNQGENYRCTPCVGLAGQRRRARGESEVWLDDDLIMHSAG